MANRDATFVVGYVGGLIVNLWSRLPIVQCYSLAKRLPITSHWRNTALTGITPIVVLNSLMVFLGWSFVFRCVIYTYAKASWPFQAMIIHSVNDPLVRGVDFDHEEVILVWHEGTSSILTHWQNLQVLFIQDWYHDEAVSSSPYSRNTWSSLARHFLQNTIVNAVRYIINLHASLVADSTLLWWIAAIRRRLRREYSGPFSSERYHQRSGAYSSFNLIYKCPQRHVVFGSGCL